MLKNHNILLVTTISYYQLNFIYPASENYLGLKTCLSQQCFGGQSLKAAKLDCCSDCMYSLRESYSKNFSGKKVLNWRKLSLAKKKSEARQKYADLLDK